MKKLTGILFGFAILASACASAYDVWVPLGGAAVLGERIAPDELKRKALSGGKNRYRDAWMKVNGEALTDFAASSSVGPGVWRGSFHQLQRKARRQACDPRVRPRLVVRRIRGQGRSVARGKGKPFPASVALIGMRDIRDYKAMIFSDSEIARCTPRGQS